MTEEQVFLAALDLPKPSDRSAYLDTVCGGDTALRRQVEELLAAHFKSGDFLNEPVVQQLQDVTVLVSDPHADPLAVEAAGGRLVPLAELLPASDIVTVHAPALPETRHMIGAPELRAMKDGADAMPALEDALLPVEAALEALPALSVSRHDAGRLARGQSIILRGRDAPVFAGTAAVMSGGTLVALAELERGELVPKRIFHLGAALA